MLELLNIVVDVTRDGPDELKAFKERLHGLSDLFEGSVGDDFELALERGEELDEVLGLCLLLDEALRLLVVLLKDGGVSAVLVGEQIDDLFDLGESKLLAEGVEGGSPV